MAQLPATNPAMPFLGKLQHPLRIGSKIKISGCMTHGGDDRFIVNLQTGAATDPRDDAALHLSVRPKQSNIVRNHYQNKGWGAEENSSHCPISQGQPYDMVIIVGRDSFDVSVNGMHYCTFRYRIPFEKISFICIQGQTTLKFVGLH